MPDGIAALRARFASAVQDQKVTAEEAQGLVEVLKEDGAVSPEELAALKELVTLHADKFEPAAAQTLRALIDAPLPPPRKDLPDPSVLTKHQDSLKWDWLPGSLFVDGVKETDVVQGSIANCYMVSAFSAIAQQNPDVIRNAFKDNGDGTFTVKLYRLDWAGQAEAVEVTIDGQLPGSYGSLTYAKGADRSELWVPLLEKAFAQFKGDYDAIGKGGLGGEVMASLTGRPYRYTALTAGMATDGLYEQLKTALGSGKAATAGTHGEDQAALYSGSGLYAWHSYTVLGVSEENGQKMVSLRNPWGSSEPGDDGKNDGIFKLDMASFAKYYSGVFVD
ncbi:MAG: C2 family cysteine protease [Myxococcaceae bacterium]